MPPKRTYSQHTKEAAGLLGQLIKFNRKKRKWSTSDLADRAGISRLTLRKIENGDPGCSVGLVFEAASLVGVPLFGSDHEPLAVHLGRITETLSLLPRSVHSEVGDVDDDF